MAAPDQAAATQRRAEELEAGLEEVLRSPASGGTVELIVRRPAEGQREVLEEAALTWLRGSSATRGARGSRRTPDGSANPNAQLTVMNARVIELVAGDRDRWALAGDQLYVDLDLSATNMPAGTRLALGSAVIEVTADPHTGCAKFVARFGHAAHRFVNSKAHRHLQLRGINAKVVEPGTVRRDDAIRTLGS